jgi:hypothetical protein
MISRRSELIVTETVRRILNALMPNDSIFHGKDLADGLESQSGVFLESKDTIHSDSFWMELVNGERKYLRRRVEIIVLFSETEVKPRP